PDDDLPRLALADWLAERCWAEEAAYYRSEFSAAAWRLELAVRDLLKLGLLEIAAVHLFAEGVKQAARGIRKAGVQRPRERPPDDPDPPAPKKRPRKKRPQK